MTSCDILATAQEWRQRIQDSVSLSDLLNQLQLLDSFPDDPRQTLLEKMKNLAVEWVDEEILQTNASSRSFVLASQGLSILPTELVTRVFTFINDLNDLINVSDTCKKFQKIVQNPSNKYFRGIKLKMSGIPSGNKNGMYAYYVKPEGLLWLDKHKNFGAKWNDMRFMSLKKFLKHSFLLEGSAAVQVSNSCWLQVEEIHRLTQKARYLRLRPGFPEGVFDRSLVSDFVKNFVQKIRAGTKQASVESPESANDPDEGKEAEEEESSAPNNKVLEVRQLDIVIQVLEDKNLSREMFPKLESISLYFGHYIDPRQRLNVTHETWWVPFVDTVYFKRSNNFTPAAHDVISQCTNISRIIFDNAGVLAWPDGVMPIIPKVDHLIIRGQTPGKIFASSDLSQCLEFTKKVTVAVRFHQTIHRTCVSNTRFLRQHAFEALDELNINIYIPFIFKYNESPCEVLTLDRFISSKHAQEDEAQQELVDDAPTNQVLTCFATLCKKVVINLRFHMQETSAHFRERLNELTREYIDIALEKEYFGDASLDIVVEYDQGTKYFEMW